jgi:hydroxyacid-oxoacid transhydrogenase
VFRFTAQACPDRHLIAAEIPGRRRLAREAGGRREDPLRPAGDGDAAAEDAQRAELGRYAKSDIPALVQGTLPQARVTKLSPRPVTETDLTHLFEDALRGW